MSTYTHARARTHTHTHTPTHTHKLNSLIGNHKIHAVRSTILGTSHIKIAHKSARLSSYNNQIASLRLQHASKSKYNWINMNKTWTKCCIRSRLEYLAALNISTGPLALHTFQTAGPVRASTLYLSLALQDHRVKCRASRLKITVARSMTNFATFSCILFLKFRYVCIAWLL